MVRKVKPITEWPIVIQATAVVTVVGLIVTAWGYRDALAEMIPFATKNFVSLKVDAVQDGLGKRFDTTTEQLNFIAWGQLQMAYRNTAAEIDRLRTQKIQLRDMIQRETDRDDQIAKEVRLEAVSKELDLREKEYDLMRCQIDKRDYRASC